MNDGINVRLTRRAIRTPKPRPTPIDCKSVKLLIVIAPNAMITVVALVAMLSPDHVTDVWTADGLSWPSTRSSRYRAIKKLEQSVPTPSIIVNRHVVAVSWMGMLYLQMS